MPHPPKPIKIGTYLDAVYPSYALLAGMQLDLFTHLKDGGRTIAQLAQALFVDEEKLSRLLYALVAAELLACEEGIFTNGDEADFYLVKGKATYLGDLHHLVGNMWRTLPLTAETIRTGVPQAKVDYSDEETIADEAQIFKGMHTATLMGVRELLKRFDLSAHRHMIDIGGGSGGLAIGLTQALPDLQVTVYDLPTVTPTTGTFVDTAPTKDRIRVVTGNAVEHPIHGTYDGAVMRSFTQVLTPEQNRRVLKHTFDALAPQSKLYIMARIVDDSRIYPAPTALFNLVFLNVYDEGRAYTESEYRTWLTDAGFTDIKITLSPRADSIVYAIRP